MEYLIGIDIGNTQTIIGLFEKNSNLEVLDFIRFSSLENLSKEKITFFLKNKDIKKETITDIIYSSVVPRKVSNLKELALSFFTHIHQEPIDVASIARKFLNFDYPNPKEIGSDRLVNVCVGAHLYGKDLILIDLGTATTFCILENGNEYKGGVIAPGLQLSLTSLIKNTAQLPNIEFSKPASGIIGKSTKEAMQSGFFYGWASLIEGISHNIKNQNLEKNYKIIGTGGFSAQIQKELPNLFDNVDTLLTLRGLKFLYQKIL